MKYLVIVESPTKARTIGKFLDKNYTIKASMGHVMDLPKSTLGVLVNDNFKPEYQIVGDKKKTIAELKSLAKNADSIILATDPDREGEAIASHIKDVLHESSTSRSKSASKFSRIVFHEITKGAIEEALKNPRTIDTNLVNAQTARRVLDRLVGYKLSPLLWQKVRRGLSAGRVQSVALRLIVERGREIEKFAKEAYWTIAALLQRDIDSHTNLPQKEKGSVEFDLIAIDDKKIEVQEKHSLYDGEYKVTKTTITSEKDAKEILRDLQSKAFVVSDIAKKQMRRSPQPPYTTSTLQQDAARRLGFSGKRTMSVAQKLYEEGFITYHRTDSVHLSTSAVNAMRKFIESTYGKEFLPDQPRLYKAKQKLAQEAHEAIRPTTVGQISNLKSQISALGNGYWRLYELIWQRAVASQMSDALTESTAVTVKTEGLQGAIYTLRANGSVLLFEGFLKVNPQALEDKSLPLFTAGEKLSLVEAKDTPHETLPPPRYNDASIIKTLEEKGIGRPSTYATIIGTIETRRYIEREQGRFMPTPVGMAVNDFLVTNFSTIDDVPFTVQMEDELDEVANGQKAWQEVMEEFYTPLAAKVSEVKDAKRVKIAAEEVDEKCPKCGNPLVIRHGRFGKFLSCSTFPECDFRKSFVEQTNISCPKDGGMVIVKKTKKGKKFYGCSNYPACDFAVWKLEDIKSNATKEEKVQTNNLQKAKEEV